MPQTTRRSASKIGGTQVHVWTYNLSTFQVSSSDGFRVFVTSLSQVWGAYALNQGCAIFFNSGPNSNKHNIVRAAPLNNIIFYQLLILLAIKIKLQ